MKYAKDVIFQIRYNTKLDRLEIRRENWTSKLYKKIKRHKLLTTTIIAFFMFATINMVMICSFMRILQNIWNDVKLEQFLEKFIIKQISIKISKYPWKN